MRYAQSDFKRALRRKGFNIDESKRDHWATFYYKSSATQFKCRVGGHDKRKYKTLGNHIVAEASRMLGFDGNILDRNLFLEFVECPFSEDYYVAGLKAAGFLIEIDR